MKGMVTMKTIKSSIYLSTEKSGGWIFPLLVVELLGISLGAFFAVNSENSGILRKYICPEVYGGAFLQVFFTAFAAYFAYLLLSFLLFLILFLIQIQIRLDLLMDLRLVLLQQLL